MRDLETIDAELRLVTRAWRALIDALLDERSSAERCGVYQSCVDPGGTAP
jgi:hypothetical protein